MNEDKILMAGEGSPIEIEGNRARIQPSNGKTTVTLDFTSHHEVSTKRPASYRWAELHCFKLASGRIVLAELGMSDQKGDRLFCDVTVCEDMNEVTDKLGYTKLSRRLFSEMGVSEVHLS